MLKFTQNKWRLQPSFTSRKSQMLKEIKEHPSWKGETSLCEANTLLKNHRPFTYILSAGMDTNHFFLSYIDFNLVVKHKNVRIIIDQGNWKFKNGTGNSYDTIDSLIPNCLHCSKNICRPLD